MELKGDNRRIPIVCIYLSLRVCSILQQQRGDAGRTWHPSMICNEVERGPPLESHAVAWIGIHHIDRKALRCNKKIDTETELIILERTTNEEGGSGEGKARQDHTTQHKPPRSEAPPELRNSLLE